MGSGWGNRGLGLGVLAVFLTLGAALGAALKPQKSPHETDNRARRLRHMTPFEVIRRKLARQHDGQSKHSTSSCSFQIGMAPTKGGMEGSGSCLKFTELESFTGRKEILRND